MNVDHLEALWGQQGVAGQSPPPAELSARLRRGIHAARRRFLGMIVMAGGLLLLEWTVAIVVHFTGIKPFTGLELAAHGVGSIFYVIWLNVAIRSARAVRSETRMMGASVRDAARASLRVIELQIRNYRVAAFLLPVAVGVTELVWFIKFRRGAFPALGVLASTLLLAIFAAIVALAMWRRYRKELEPGRRELSALLASIAEEEK